MIADTRDTVTHAWAPLVALVAGIGASLNPSNALLLIGVCFLAVAGLAALVIPRNAPMGVRKPERELEPARLPG